MWGVQTELRFEQFFQLFDSFLLCFAAFTKKGQIGSFDDSFSSVDPPNGLKSCKYGLYGSSVRDSEPRSLFGFRSTLFSAPKWCWCKKSAWSALVLLLSPFKSNKSNEGSKYGFDESPELDFADMVAMLAKKRQIQMSCQVKSVDSC